MHAVKKGESDFFIKLYVTTTKEKIQFHVDSLMSHPDKGFVERRQALKNNAQVLAIRQTNTSTAPSRFSFINCHIRKQWCELDDSSFLVSRLVHHITSSPPRQDQGQCKVMMQIIKKH